MRNYRFEIAKFSGGCIGRVTPVPIPNTEVKPTGADDTASFRCGKVGSRRIYFKKARFDRSGLSCAPDIAEARTQ